MAHDRLRKFNKYVTNRILRNFARLRRGPFAVLQHVGRKSGKSYETTLLAWPVEGGFVFALTYGPEVDWYRNLRAAGRGKLFWHGKVFLIGEPETIDAGVALPALPPLIRTILEKRGVPLIRVKTLE